MPEGQAALQLCAPLPAVVLSKPPPGDLMFAEMLCDSASYRCSQGVVVKCGDGPPAALAACTRGCADEDTVVEDDSVSADQAVAILCTHAAEDLDLPKPGKRPAPN